MTKTALITGITGQDGYYLSKHLLSLGYEVHGLQQHTISDPPYQIPLGVVMHTGDMTDGNSITAALVNSYPDEVYNLAAMSHVGASFNIPEYAANVNALGTLRLLESVRLMPYKPHIYQAGTSEMFGNAQTIQHEMTPLQPRIPLRRFQGVRPPSDDHVPRRL